MSEQMRQYWQERFKQMEEAQHDTSVQKVQEIQEQFEKAQAAIGTEQWSFHVRGKENAHEQRTKGIPVDVRGIY